MEPTPSSAARSSIAPVEMHPNEFKEAGYMVVNQIAELLESFNSRAVSTNPKPSTVRARLGESTLPIHGSSAMSILEEIIPKLTENSLYNSHPRFWAYITSSPAPIGILGEMLAAALNPNVGAYSLSPMATEMEKQVIQWIAEFIGYHTDCGGILVSGGSMANYVGFLAARKSIAHWDVRKEGLGDKRLTLYCAKGTHTWVEKAADLYGLGTNAIRWIRVEENGQLDTRMLEERIIQDQKEGYYPFLVVGTAGSVSIGVVDPLDKISSICKKHNMWFHIDGAYGILAAGLPEESKQFKGMKQADSIALDPHKWLYSPLEAGCVLVKDKKLLRDTFSFSPDYYHFAEEKEEPETNFYEYGPQNSRGFKALKVWLALKQAGRSGYVQMLRDDILLSKKLRDMLQNHENFEVMTNHLSITTFRYLPLKTSAQQSFGDDYLNLLNKNLVTALQEGGKVYCSNAIINDQYCLRVCIVNFRTRENDLSVLVTAALEEGKKIHDDLFERYPR